MEQLIRIGQQVETLKVKQDFDKTERIVMGELGKDLIVGNEEDDIQLPILQDSRISMGKIQEAQRILQELGLPPAQQNEISALTLLALCNLSETVPSKETITIHNMMGFMKQHYGRIYAENTREVVRRQVIHQFEQARIVDRNPDDPTRPTNSPNTCYALTEDALDLLRQYGTQTWEDTVTYFLEKHGALWEHYQRSRQSVALPLKLADGQQLYLTPGKHNKLQIAIILYLGDAANKFMIYERERLEQLLKECTAKRVYLSAFLDFAEFRRHTPHIAWETEVWIAEIPEHMIHYNGEKFLGPYE